MSGAPEVRTSTLQWDGKTVQVLGLGQLSHNTTLQAGTVHMAPFDGYIQEVIVSIATAGTHASAGVNLGSPSAQTSILNGKNVQNLTGVVTYTQDADFVSAAARNVNKGDLLQFSTPAASAVGNAAMSVVIVPR